MLLETLTNKWRRAVSKGVPTLFSVPFGAMSFGSRLLAYPYKKNTIREVSTIAYENFFFGGRSSEEVRREIS